MQTVFDIVWLDVVKTLDKIIMSHMQDYSDAGQGLKL